MGRVLLLGLGNDILTDDGIGFRLVHDVSGLPALAGADVRIAACGGLEVMEMIGGYQRVVIVDAIRTRDGRPGDVSCFSLQDGRNTLHLSSLHDISFHMALAMAGKVGITLPSCVHIIAVEIAEDMVFSEEFSLVIRERYGTILDTVRNMITHLLSAEQT